MAKKTTEPPFWRCLCAEIVGTFALVFVDCGGAVMQDVGRYGEVTPEGRALATGLVVAAMIYSLGNASGAHINPAVTAAFALRGAFPWRRVPAYIAVQLTGAVMAALVLLALFGHTADLGATRPHHGSVTALCFEVILNAILATVVLSTATRHKVVGPDAALAVGASVALCGLFGRSGSGASMNPARSFGPALLVGGDLNSIWVYVLGPIAGATLAVLVVRVVHGPPKDQDAEVAQGEG